MNPKPRPKEKLISALPLFAHSGQHALRRLASAADEITVPPGTQVIEEGRNHSFVYLVLDGQAVVRVGGDEVAVISDGEVFGELAFFSQGSASATVEASTELDVLAIPFQRLNEILDDDPSLSRSLLRALADRLRNANVIHTKHRPPRDDSQ